MHARGERQTAREQELDVLQVALAPAAVPCDHVAHRWRCFLIGLIEVGIETHTPARAAQECGFNKVVADNMAAKGCIALQDRQVCSTGKRTRADDGVMAPEVAAIAVPCRQAVAENQAVTPVRELLQSRIELSPMTMDGRLCSRPRPSSASIRRAISIMVSALMMLSASSTSMAS